MVLVFLQGEMNIEFAGKIKREGLSLVYLSNSHEPSLGLLIASVTYP